MEKKGVSLVEQMQDVEIFKEIQEEHNVTEKHVVDEYRMDIEDRIKDINIKKQAIAVVDQIENDIEENKRIQEEEYEQENEQYVSSEQEFYIVGSEKVEEDNTLEENKIGDVVPDHLTNEEDDEKEPLNKPLHVLTEEEKEAMDALTAFNRESRERTYEGLENIASTTDNSQNTAALKAVDGLNVAKEGLNNLKKGITSKIENVDAEKLDEHWQNFWLMMWSILKGFIDITAVVVIAAYKIPAKRHYKKRLDYTVNEVNGKDLKSMMEIQQNQMKHRFIVDWLPKLILLFSAVLIYKSIWNVGLIALGIGFVYYMMTYLTFDYGGSRLLNVLAENMDKQGIRLKDSYFNNMVVLYRYFDEYQKALGVSIDESGKIEIYEDKELGSILTFYINEDKNVTINSITDNRLTYYKVVPFLDEYNDNAKLQNKRQVAVMLDQILLMAINKDEDVSELYAKKEEFWNCFPELKGLADQRQAEAEALLLKLEREKLKEEVRKIVVDKGINENAINVILTIFDRKREWQFNVWNVSETALVGNENYMKVRCIFNQKGNMATVNGLKGQLESKFRSQILTKTLQDRGSFDLYVLFKSELSAEAINVEDLKVYNEKDEIYIGNSLTGKLSAKWNSAANHILVGGTSGSGKSAEILNLLSQLPWLKSYDYTTMFITSSSKIGDFVPFAKKGALVTSGVEKQEKVFNYILELLTKREETFYARGVDNLMSYNQKHPNNQMKQIILVADEWENSLGDLDGKLAKRLEGLLVQILNIARSSGCLVIVGAQSILKGDIGTVVNKMFVKYSGSNDKPILRTIDPEIANYYGSLAKKPQGVFFYSSSNTPAKQESLFFGETNYTLVQTPFLKEIEAKTLDSKLPQLHGKEFENEIFNGEINEELDEQEVVTYNLNDVEDNETALNAATEDIEGIAEI